ncbi:hypothetical protein [Rhodothermus profundi]|uniref:Lipoprotein n=1 Tax=Rhodothermus profundi TaxID=633813 RepID=A0A1M6WAX4_9BACT|nr:hypothetical protein [Rhodothermus profundi]SHK90923.1 hypothetical protein SAMN04488087_2260 [Rhodothermus profundi]
MRRWGNWLGVVGSLGCLLLLGACDLLRGQDAPERARLRIEGASDSTLILVTSTNFLLQRTAILDEAGIARRDTLLVYFLEADTLQIQLPYNQEYDIRLRERFFVRLRPGAAGVRMRVWIDDQLRYDTRPEETIPLLQFVYFRVKGTPPYNEFF